MATEIRVWQINDGNLESIDISMAQAGRREVDDLEKWIKSNTVILGEDVLIIGEQVPTRGGFMDFLGLDQSGNLIVIELKRDKLPREALAQAMDYASDIASWGEDKISEVCLKFSGQDLEDYLNEKFGDVDWTDLVLNKTQRILLVGFSVEESLQRMIEWLSNNYGVSINAIILRYIKTTHGDELIARTMIIPEEIAKEIVGKKQIKIPMSDIPGNYSDEELEPLLKSYLSETRLTPRRIREILLPLCLNHNVATREMIKRELIERGEATNEGAAGIILSTISGEIGRMQRDYLRQVIQYDKPNPWEKENYRLQPTYRDMVKRILENELSLSARS
ncbi:MAG TPA: hypothetical protein VF543_02585 [Pyrinomonadaceae bacterium]|jgi:hypothetical protein